MFDDDENDLEADASEYNTEGNVTVATRRGHAFVSSDPDIPQIHAEGVTVTDEQAEFLAKESAGLVRIINEDKE